MGKIASSLSDFVIVTSDNPRYENPEMIIDDILRGNVHKDLTSIVDRKEAIEYALNMAEKNDLVAILGKGAETYQEVNGIKLHFSDYEVVDNYFKTRVEKSELKA